MSAWLNYKGIEVPSATPPVNAGERLRDDILELADRAPTNADTDPTISDDSDTGFFVGSQWLNTATGVMWVCTDATADAAVWKSLYKRVAGALVLCPEGDGAVQIDNLQLDGNTLSSLDTNGSILIEPNGSGSIQVDSGGNARGGYAVDFQAERTLASQVASGANAFVAGGQNNTASGARSHAQNNETTASGTNSSASGTGSTASGSASHAEGEETTASGQAAHAEGFHTVASGAFSHAAGFYTTANFTAARACGSRSRSSAGTSYAGGQFSVAHLVSQWSRGSGGVSGQSGTAQSSHISVFRRTTDATATELTLAGIAPASGSRIIILDGQTLSCLINIVGREENGGANDHASFLRQVLIRREGSTTQLVGSVQTLGTDINPAGWGGVTITADDTNESLKIEVTGAASTNIRWAAAVMTSEVADAAI
jgi:hypothetical protein